MYDTGIRTTHFILKYQPKSVQHFSTGEEEWAQKEKIKMICVVIINKERKKEIYIYMYIVYIKDGEIGDNSKRRRLRLCDQNGFHVVKCFTYYLSTANGNAQ